MIDRPVFDARLPMFVGFVALILLVFGIGIWSVRTQIAGAVIATGMIVVENNRQVIQHPEGGVVGMVEARDGDVVAAGDLLIRLDDTLLRSELAVAELQLVELGARRARLTAERDGAEAPSFPPQLLAKPAYAEQVNGQLNLFKARLDSLEREDSQIAEQIAQTGTQIVGTEAQLDALKIQESLILDELTDVEALLEKGLVQS
ncbi:MAG: biotin/lipoyl-binding protein, partial [Pseudomonadota bacterium]